jgi:hypothetical protein
MVLEKRYRCPKCHRDDRLTVVVSAAAHLIQEEDGNFQTDLEDNDHTWDKNSPMWCGCGHFAMAGDFLVEERIPSN